ncbi:MAG TPA: DinB family protein [Planctomycetota bacterium]|nr:DinB family protein [Planctomycetota bacterium]
MAAAKKTGAALLDQIVEAWRTNQRINRKLISSISDEGMRSTLSKRGGRDVCRQFAHLHNVRIWHLEARAKALAKGARKFATKEEPSRRELLDALEDSAKRVEELFRRVAAGEPGARAMKRGLVQYLAYFVAHESHHRGNILLTLKQCGHPVDQDTRYAIWDWDRI